MRPVDTSEGATSISVGEHRSRVVSLASLLPTERVAASEGFGQVLAEDVIAAFAVPPFDNSAMDGFAVRTADIATVPTTLPVSRDLPAGASDRSMLQPGTVARIMTGAPVPMGADAVVRVEDTDHSAGDPRLPSHVTFTAIAESGRNVRRAGEDVQAGDAVLAAGQRWTPAAAAAAVSVGHSQVLLRRRPRVAVISTGSELVSAGRDLDHGQIPDSNSLMIAGLARHFGADVDVSRSVGDDPTEFADALAAAADADVVVTTGGVSAGAYEIVKQVLGNQIQFSQVALRPGKPQGAGIAEVAPGVCVPLLAFPGNPVSAYVSAWLFLRPFLSACVAETESTSELKLAVAQGWSSPAGRFHVVPVRVGANGVFPARRTSRGSHFIATLHQADGLALVDEEVASVEPGDMVTVVPTGW